jgi:hypothetical protein
MPQSQRRTRVGVVLMLFATSVWPAQPASDPAWAKCMAAAQDSPTATKIQKESGVLGLNEWLVERCGVRPTQRTGKHGQRLKAGDCDKVYQLAQDGSCDRAEYSAYQDSLFEQLNAEVFRENRFKAVCERMRTVNVSRKQFQAAVCEASR